MFNDPVSPVIFLTAGLGLLLQLVRSFFYSRELRHIRIARARLSSFEGGELDLGVPRNSEVGQRAAWVAELASRRLPIHVADFSQALELRDEASLPNRLSQYIISILLIGGLFGTLMALAHALGDPSLFTADGTVNAERLKEFVDRVYKGLSGAFDATKWGIGCTIGLLFTRALLISGPRSRFLSGLDEFTSNELIPRLIKLEVPPSHGLSEVASRLKEVTERLSALGAGLAQTHEDAKASTAQLLAFSERLNEGAEKLTAVFAQGTPVERAMASMAAATNEQRNVLSQWRAVTAEDRQTLMIALAKVEAALVANAELHAQTQAIATSFRNAMTQSLTVLSESRATLNKMFEEQGRVFMSEVNERKSTSQAVGRQLENINKRNMALERIGGELRAAANAIDQTSKLWKEASAEFAAALLKDREQATACVREIQDAIGGVEKSLTGSLEKIGIVVGEELKHNADSVRLAGYDFARGFGGIEGLGKLPAILSKWADSATAISTSLEQFKGEQSTLVATVVDVRDAIREMANQDRGGSLWKRLTWLFRRK